MQSQLGTIWRKTTIRLQIAEDKVEISEKKCCTCFVYFHAAYVIEEVKAEQVTLGPPSLSPLCDQSFRW